MISVEIPSPFSFATMLLRHVGSVSGKSSR